MPRLKTIKLNLTFKSHTSYPSNKVWTQSKPEGLEVQSPCSLHPKLFNVMSCYSNASVTDRPPSPLHRQLSRSKGYFDNLSVVFLSEHFLLNSKQWVSLIKLPNRVHSLTAKGKTEHCNIPKVTSSIHHTGTSGSYALKQIHSLSQITHDFINMCEKLCKTHCLENLRTSYLCPFHPPQLLPGSLSH